MKSENIDNAWSGTEKCRQCAIRALVLFADLQYEDFCLLHLPIEEITIDAHGVLYEAQDAPRYLYTVRQGLLKLVHDLPDGNYRVVRLLRQGDLAGMEALNHVNYIQHAIALNTTVVCRIPVEAIELLNRQTPRLYRQLTAKWQQIQQEADIWLTEFTVGHARQRVAKLLLFLAGRSQNTSFFLPGREDIGALLAITTETASRIIAEFKRSGYLKTSGHSATIDRPKIERMK